MCDGWIAIYNGKKVEIKNDGSVNGIYGAQLKAMEILSRGWELLLSADDAPNCRMVTLARCSASKVKEVKFYTSGESVEFYYRQG